MVLHLLSGGANNNASHVVSGGEMKLNTVTFSIVMIASIATKLGK